MGRGGEHGVDCSYSTEQNFLARDRRCGGSNEGGIWHWDHEAVTRDLEFGSGLRCLWTRVAQARESWAVRGKLPSTRSRCLPIPQYSVAIEEQNREALGAGLAFRCKPSPSEAKMHPSRPRPLDVLLRSVSN